MELLFATGNDNKTREISQMLGEKFKLLSLNDIQCFEEIPETSGSIEGNAIQKALYAGDQKDPEANMAKVLSELNNNSDRIARFRTVIAYVNAGDILTFEGVCEGNIATEKMGEKGFGYDPIFIPENEKRSFAQMSSEEKNQISHRARAFKKFMKHLKL